MNNYSSDETAENVLSKNGIVNLKLLFCRDYSGLFAEQFAAVDFS